MSKEESFEEWFKKNKSPAAFSPYGKEMEEMTSWQAWNRQQAKLDKALQKIEQLSQIIEQKDRDLKVREHLTFGYLIAENSQLKEALKLAVEVIGFYGEPYYWDNINYPNMFIGKDDLEENVGKMHIDACGGKKARQFLESEQYKKVEGSL